MRRALPLLIGLVSFSSGLAADSNAAIEKGVAWLLKGQNPDGGFGPYGEGGKSLRLTNTSDVGVSAFALYALAKGLPQGKAASMPAVGRAVDFVLSKQQENGGFYDLKDPTLQNYKTCVALLAFNTLDRVKHTKAISKAQEFIKKQQFTEEDGYKPDENFGYGGIGYGSKQRPDLSNTQFGVEALAESGLSGSDELWKKAVIFIARTRNAKTVDPILKELKIGTSGDGGYRYAPDETRGPTETLDDGTRVFSSYGSMTYAALKSLLYANVKKEDSMVEEAFVWISKHFDVQENPGMSTKQNPRAGQQGLFYYYHTMAKALSLYGQTMIKDEKGIEHNWAKELGGHLAGLQTAEGSWENTSERWMEEIPMLATSYAVVALAECQASLSRAGAAQAGESSSK